MHRLYSVDCFRHSNLVCVCIQLIVLDSHLVSDCIQLAVSDRVILCLYSVDCFKQSNLVSVFSGPFQAEQSCVQLFSELF